MARKGMFGTNPNNNPENTVPRPYLNDEIHANASGIDIRSETKGRRTVY